jgi:hypothetical protein
MTPKTTKQTQALCEKIGRIDDRGKEVWLPLDFLRMFRYPEYHHFKSAFEKAKEIGIKSDQKIKNYFEDIIGMPKK